MESIERRKKKHIELDLLTTLLKEKSHEINLRFFSSFAQTENQAK